MKTWNTELSTTIVAFFVSSLITSAGIVRYVDVNSPNPTPPYTNWATAASVVQDAVDAAAAGDEIIVTNGVYTTGGRAVYGTMTNRVTVDKPLTLRSVNGPTLTLIQGRQLPGFPVGNGAIRCVYLATGARLVGFTLTNGATRMDGDFYQECSGAGVWCESTNVIITNCVLVGNASYGNGAGAYRGALAECSLTRNTNRFSGSSWGAGASDAILYDCTLTDNFAGGGAGAANCLLFNCTLRNNRCDGISDMGGAALNSTLFNCTLTGNGAKRGGGAANSILNNCTVSSNGCWHDGGGLYFSSATNCTLVGNRGSYWGGGASGGTLVSCMLQWNGAEAGGGAADSLLINCALVANGAWGSLNDGMGGGASGGTLINCTLVSNLATNTVYKQGKGGGTYSSVVKNCVVYFNAASTGENHFSSTVDHSCTTPLPTTGIGNITTAPLFVEANDWMNLRLQSNSPCINAGNNPFVSSSADLDGRPRVVGGTVDMGAYEHQGSDTEGFISWLWQFGLPTDGSADFVDTDLDGHNNWQEWQTDTVPTNALSKLTMLAPTNATNGVAVSWQSVSSRSYFVQRGTSLGESPAMLTLATNLVGQTGATTFTDTTATNGGPFFYRVGVQP